MKTTVIYHHDAEGWWAESPEVDGFTAVAETFDELRTMATEAIGFYLEEDVEVEESLATSAHAALMVWRGINHFEVGTNFAGPRHRVLTSNNHYRREVARG